MKTSELTGASDREPIVPTCGIIFPSRGPAPRDDNGCRLPEGHDGHHEFVCRYQGIVYQWETDWECDCESCFSDYEDLCVKYWNGKTVGDEVEAIPAAKGGAV